ncbi:MAG: gamma carbonic anhydrase family protein, partial [Flavobacteriales bacterium]
ALVQAESVWPDRSLLVGNPAVRKGEVSDAMLAHKREGTALYAALPADMHRSAPECSSLSEDPGNRPEDFPVFETWAARKRKS